MYSINSTPMHSVFIAKQVLLMHYSSQHYSTTLVPRFSTLALLPVKVAIKERR